MVDHVFSGAPGTWPSTPFLQAEHGSMLASPAVHPAASPGVSQRARVLAKAVQSALLGLVAIGATLPGNVLLGQVTPPPPPAGQNPPQGPTPRLVVDQATDTIAFSMNESNGMELSEFIKWTQEVTGRRFTFSLNELQGAGQGGSTISFLGTFRIKRDRFADDFFSFFQTMLYIKGFAVVPRGEGDLEMLEIVNMAGPRNREITNGAKYVTPDELPNFRNQTGVPILTTVPLKNINAQVATNALRPFYAQTGTTGAGASVTLGNVGTNSALLVQGFGPQVFAAVELLKLVDVPTEPPNLVVQVMQLEHQAPEELEPILTDVLESRNRIRAAILQGEQVGAQGSAASAQPQLKVVVHSSQKALVLSGTKDHVNEALDLIARLDVPGLPIDGAASVIPLKNVLAEDLRATLNTFMTEDNSAETQAATPAGAGAAAARRTRKTVIQAHKESNSLLVSAAGTKWAQIQALIDKIDRRQPQVLIEAALVELTTGDLDRFGVELGLLDLKANGNFTRGFGFSSFGQSAFTDNDGDGLPDTRLPDFANPLQGLTGGIISGGDFSVPLLINALSSDDRANILSLPSVLVNNNETAIVKTEEERPTTQSTQGTSTTQQSNGPPRNAGVTLEISPTISPNNYLRLNISLEVSRFVGAFDPNSATGGGIVLRRTIKTQVTMPSDATMVLGGVIEDSESWSDGGIPLLKDIPLLGFLFRRSESTTNKTNLYFFVTPTILDEDDFQDLWHVSLQRKLEAADYIGERRLRIIDRRWNGTTSAQARTLEDMGTTVEDLDAQGEYEMPTYRRTTPIEAQGKQPGTPTAPRSPDAVDGAHSGGPRNGGTHGDAPGSGASSRSGAKSSGATSSSATSSGAKSGGATSGGAKSSGAKNR
ncbi:MAG: secretin N-terminal domain-containing protein [Planctomycetota bacterium]